MSAHKLGSIENDSNILSVLNKLDIQREINLITTTNKELLEEINESKDKQQEIITTFKELNEKLEEVKKNVRRHIKRGVDDLGELLEKKSFMIEFNGRSDLFFGEYLNCKNCEIALVDFETKFDKKILEGHFNLDIITNTFVNGKASKRFFTWKKDIDSPITDELIEEEGVTELKLQPNKLIYFPIREQIDYMDFILTNHKEERVSCFYLKLRLHIKT